MAQLCQHQDELEQLNVEVLVISFSTPPFARAWLEETCSPFRLLLDPEREVYATYELERSFWRSWNLRTLGRYIRLLWAGRKWRGIQGDSTQLGGDFIVDTRGMIQLAHRSHDPTDRPTMDQLLDIFQKINSTEGKD